MSSNVSNVRLVISLFQKCINLTSDATKYSQPRYIFSKLRTHLTRVAFYTGHVVVKKKIAVIIVLTFHFFFHFRYF